MKRFDLHTHSIYSDGTYAPVELVCAAAEVGLSFIALTDHDCMDGVHEAVHAGEKYGLCVLAGVEFDCAWTHELHILGLGLDADNQALRDALSAARLRRKARNDKIFSQLALAGCNISPNLSNRSDSCTRLHIAVALKDAGYACSVRDAFERFLY